MSQIDKLIHDKLIHAAENMDWMQVVLNEGPPCFALFDDGYCGRAKRWEGHGDGQHHDFVCLADLLIEVSRLAKKH